MIYKLSSVNDTARSRYAEGQVQGKYQKAIKLAPNFEQKDYLLFLILSQAV
jgi:hypothetical protein